MENSKEIKCPKCGEVFKVDASFYASVVKQIKDSEFKKELERQVKSLKESAEKDKQISEKDKAIAINQATSEISEKLSKANLEIDRLNNELKSQKEKSDLEKEKAIETVKSELNIKLVKTNTELINLKANSELQVENVKNELKLKYEQNQNETKSKYESILKEKEDEINYYKDLKSKLSTKMVGETLEQHCEIEFNKLRAIAFKNAEFGKDNNISSGSKGDYIYRDFDDEKNEIISIMFEMKNEEDMTATKKCNEDFLKKLDKDRTDKKCEYAVLVSLLEKDNEFYNTGIVDMSHKYEKMYVIRPQFFLPLITILKNASMKSSETMKELVRTREQNIDISNFEENIQRFKDGFSRNYRLASEQFSKAIDEIDKTILHLTKVKESLTSSERNLRLANEKAEDLSIKKLTKNNPTMEQMFKDIKEKNN